MYPFIQMMLNRFSSGLRSERIEDIDSWRANFEWWLTPVQELLRLFQALLGGIDQVNNALLVCG